MCEHLSFESRAVINRLSDREGGPITGYNVNFTVNCRDCGLKFQFPGLPVGALHDGAAVSADGLECRLAIVPDGTLKLGPRATYTMPVKHKLHA